MSAEIESVRVALLALHKALIDLARADHEKQHQHKLTPGELLQLLTSDAAFDWLHPFSRLIVAIDELLERELPPTQRDAAAVRVEVEKLLSSGGEHYATAIDRDPNVALEQGRTSAALGKLPASRPEEREALLQLRETWHGPRRRRRGPAN